MRIYRSRKTLSSDASSALHGRPGPMEIIIAPGHGGFKATRA